MELLGGAPVPAIEFGCRTLTNSLPGDDNSSLVSPQHHHPYASLSNSSSSRLDVRVYAGKFRGTLIESLFNIVCRVELETIQFKGDRSDDDDRMYLEEKKEAAKEKAAATNASYMLWLREITSVDTLADRVVLVSGDSDDGGGGRNVTIYCHGDVSVAAAIGKVIKARVGSAIQLYRIQQRRQVERDDEMDAFRSGRRSSSRGRYDPAISLTGGGGGSHRSDLNIFPGADDDEHYRRAEGTGGGRVGSGGGVLTVPVSSHSAASLPLRNFTRAANSFTMLATALKESTDTDNFEDNLRAKMRSEAAQDESRLTMLSRDHSNIEEDTAFKSNVAGDYISDDILNPRLANKEAELSRGRREGGIIMDATASKHQREYINSSTFTGGVNSSRHVVNTNVLAATYSHYPALRSPYQTHPSPSQPYRAVAAEKSAAQQEHLSLLNSTREAERREAVARAQVEDLSRELLQMKSEISVLKTAQSARYGHTRGGGAFPFGVEESPGSPSLLKSPDTPTRGGDGVRRMINFDAILEPSIDVKALQHLSTDTSDQTSAKRAAAELLLRSDTNNNNSNNANHHTSRHHLIGSSTAASINHILAASHGGTSPTQMGSPSAYNQTLARSVAAGGGANRRGSMMLDSLMVASTSGDGRGGGGLTSPLGGSTGGEMQLSSPLFDGIRRTVSHRSERHVHNNASSRVRVQSPLSQDSSSKVGAGVSPSNPTGSGTSSMSVTPLGSQRHMQHQQRRESGAAASLVVRSTSGKEIARSASSHRLTSNREHTSSLSKKGFNQEEDTRNNHRFPVPHVAGVVDEEDVAADPLDATQVPKRQTSPPMKPISNHDAVVVGTESVPIPPVVQALVKKGVPPPPPKKSVPAAAWQSSVVGGSEPAVAAAAGSGGPSAPKGVAPPPPKKSAPTSQPVDVSLPAGDPSAPKGVPPPPPKKSTPAPSSPPPPQPTAVPSNGPPPPRGVPPPPPKKAVPKPPAEPI